MLHQLFLCVGKGIQNNFASIRRVVFVVGDSFFETFNFIPCETEIGLCASIWKVSYLSGNFFAFVRALFPQLLVFQADGVEDERTILYPFRLCCQLFFRLCDQGQVSGAHFIAGASPLFLGNPFLFGTLPLPLLAPPFIFL